MKRIVLLTIAIATTLSIQAQYEKEPESDIYKHFKMKLKFDLGTVTLKDSTVLEGMIRRYSTLLVDGDIKIVTKDGKKRLFYARDVLSYKTREKYVTFDNGFYKEEIANRNLSLYSRIETTSTTGYNGRVQNSSRTVYYLKKSNEYKPQVCIFK